MPSIPKVRMALGQEHVPDRTVSASAANLAGSYTVDKSRVDATQLGPSPSSTFMQGMDPQLGSRHHSAAGSELLLRPASVQHAADMALQKSSANDDASQACFHHVQGRCKYCKMSLTPLNAEHAPSEA
jgi:hypothetical protein